MGKVKPSPKEDRIITCVGLVFSVGWCFLPRYPDLFYGEYGAILFGLMTAGVAYWKNRNPYAWFAVGLWIVLAGLTIALIVPRLADALCPFCREAVDPEASVCPHCQREIPARQKATTMAATGL